MNPAWVVKEGLLQGLTFILSICICWDPSNHYSRPRTFRIIDKELPLKKFSPYYH